MPSDMKTSESDVDPRAYIASVPNAGRQEDAVVLLEMMERETGWPARMWGASLIGFGKYQYTWADGSQHSCHRVGFSPRKANMVVYVMPGVKRYEDILGGLGPYKSSVSCLYLGRFKNIDLTVLEKVIIASVKDMARLHPE